MLRVFFLFVFVGADFVMQRAIGLQFRVEWCRIQELNNHI